MRTVRILLWLTGAAYCATMTVGAIRGDVLSPDKAVAHWGTGLILITAGLLLWERRPETRTGMLITGASFAFLVNELPAVFPGSAVAMTAGLATTHLDVPIIAQTVLSYPTGRLGSRRARAFVTTCYAFWFAYAGLLLLFYDPRAPHDPDVWEWPRRALPLTHVQWHDVTGARRALDGVLLVLIVGFVALLIDKLVRATPGGRRIVLPLAVAALFVAAQFAVQVGLWAHGSSTNFWTSSAMFWSETIATLGGIAALAAGVLSARTARSAVADLVVELDETPPGSVRDALARTLGDPSLELALWLPERAAYVDATGHPVELPGADSDRAVTVLGPAEAPVGALVHDPALLERQALLTAAGAAARLALENERLQAELRAQLTELRASRARIVTAGDEERRRLERDLHDGAQQRLLGIGLALQLARAELDPNANGTAELLAEADAELRAALDELRELARGIHPAVLTEHGLEAALKTLVARSPLPVELRRVPATRFPQPIEAAAYFVVSEALANVAKHAQASAATVCVGHDAGTLLVEVADDGVGGAAPKPGSGLSGLADRVHALDGILSVESPTGAGTTLRAEIPCAVPAAELTHSTGA